MTKRKKKNIKKMQRLLANYRIADDSTVAGIAPSAPLVSRGTITIAQYERLKTAYLETRSVERSAQAAGVGYNTARKYITQGADGLPPIAEEVKRLMSMALQERNDQATREFKAHKGIQLQLLSKLVQAVDSVELAPKGKRNAAGKIEVDEYTFSAIANTARTLARHGKDLDGGTATPRTSPNQVHVNINNQVGASSNSAAGVNVDLRREALRRANEINAQLHKQGYADSQIHKAVVEESGLRGRDVVGEEIDDEEED